MADTYKILYQGQLPATVGTLCTVGVAKMWIIKHMTIVNVTTVERTFQLFINGTASANAITPTMQIPGKSMAEWDGTQALNASEYLAGLCNEDGTSLTLTIDGDEIS